MHTKNAAGTSFLSSTLPDNRLHRLLSSYRVSVGKGKLGGPVPH